MTSRSVKANCKRKQQQLLHNNMFSLGSLRKYFAFSWSSYPGIVGVNAPCTLPPNYPTEKNKWRRYMHKLRCIYCCRYSMYSRVVYTFVSFQTLYLIKSEHVITFETIALRWLWLKKLYLITWKQRSINQFLVKIKP